MEVSFYVGKKYYTGCEETEGGSSCDVESVSSVLNDEAAAAQKYKAVRRKENSEQDCWRGAAVQRQKMTRRKSDGSYCLLILHNKLCDC